MFGWLRKKKEHTEARVKARWEQARDTFTQMKEPLSQMERRKNWVKVCLWIALAFILLLLLQLDWFDVAGIFALVLVVISWMRGWDFLAGEISKRLTKTRSALDPVKDRDVMLMEAEQRLLRILVTMRTWETLTPQDRRARALQALDCVYQATLGKDMTTTTVAPTPQPTNQSQDDPHERPNPTPTSPSTAEHESC